MAKRIRKTIRIYRQHDLDLYYLGLSKEYHLPQELKRALLAYIKGTEFIPKEIPKRVDCPVVKKSMALTLYFDISKPDEKEALELLNNSIKYGYVCPFVKMLYRNYLTTLPPLSVYFSDNGLQMTNAEVVRSIQKKQAEAIMSSVLNTEESDLLTETVETPLDDSENFSKSSKEPQEDLMNLFMQMNNLSH